MITDFPTAPLAPGLIGAGGGTVEKSLSASHTEILTPPPDGSASNPKIGQVTSARPPETPISNPGTVAHDESLVVPRLVVVE